MAFGSAFHRRSITDLKFIALVSGTSLLQSGSNGPGWEQKEHRVLLLLTD
jgi:hypothetical protein